MNPLILGTHNSHKVSEYQHIFSVFSDNFSKNSPENKETSFSIQALPSDKTLSAPEETGKTFSENSELKALHYSTLLNKPVLADDSGLCVSALNGAPGIHSSRFSSETATDQENNVRLLQELQPFPEPSSREAQFVCSLSYAFQGKVLRTVVGTVSGLILHKPAGTHGFGYDPLFFHPPSEKCFSEMSASEKNKVSHRYQAVSKIFPFLI